MLPCAVETFVQQMLNGNLDINGCAEVVAAVQYVSAIDLIQERIKRLMLDPPAKLPDAVDSDTCAVIPVELVGNAIVFEMGKHVTVVK